MNTKPATPLPYEAHTNPDKRTAEILSKAGTVVGTVSADCAVYIVHACNAYPELVAALRGMIASNAEHAPAYKAVCAGLLAKLGEDK